MNEKSKEQSSGKKERPAPKGWLARWSDRPQASNSKAKAQVSEKDGPLKQKEPVKKLRSKGFRQLRHPAFKGKEQGDRKKNKLDGKTPWGDPERDLAIKRGNERQRKTKKIRSTNKRDCYEKIVSGLTSQENTEMESRVDRKQRNEPATLYNSKQKQETRNVPQESPLQQPGGRKNKTVNGKTAEDLMPPQEASNQEGLK